MITTMNPITPTPRSSVLPAFLLTFAILICVALPVIPKAFGVSPPPDGGYPNGNTAEGDNALLSLSSGIQNTALGFLALGSDQGGSQNTATGYDALLNNTSGSSNTATGFEALFDNTQGGFNTAMGAGALTTNTTGAFNTATGFEALFKNTTGFSNVATGYQALFNNTTGGGNTAMGLEALFSNTTGSNNTAAGNSALVNNTTGSPNTATGVQALFYNTTGGDNVATGFDALVSNTAGNGNVAEGDSALANNTTGSNNVAVGLSAGSNLTSGSNNIDIGANVLGVAKEANTTRIGNNAQKKTFIGGISGKTVPSGVTVIINSNGQLGTIQSSARFKTAIKPMDKVSETILALKPVTFCYKEELDPDKTPQFGLIAEEVEKVDPNLVVRDEDGRVSTVRYEAVNAMVLNEFLKEHRKVEELTALVAQQRKDYQSRIAEQDRKIEAFSVWLEKVSNQAAQPTLVADN